MMQSNHPGNGTADASRSQLVNIIKKIGQKETVREGMMELHHFQQVHPDLDIKVRQLFCLLCDYNMG